VALGAFYQLLRCACFRNDILLHSFLVPREKSDTRRAELPEFKAAKQNGLDAQTGDSGRSSMQLLLSLLDAFSRFPHFPSNWNKSD